MGFTEGNIREALTGGKRKLSGKEDWSFGGSLPKLKLDTGPTESRHREPETRVAALAEPPKIPRRVVVLAVAVIDRQKACRAALLTRGPGGTHCWAR